MAEVKSEEYAFEIIAAVGTARSSYIGAIDASTDGNDEEAQRLLKEGKEAFVKGHDAHARLLRETATGKRIEMDLLLTHAEDQLMSAEAFGILAERFIALNKKIQKLEVK